jgi:hypothetical protein
MSWKCDATYHLRHSGLMLALYNKIGAITWDPENHVYRDFTTTARRLALFYRADHGHVAECLRNLKAAGWIAKVAEGTVGRMEPVLLDDGSSNNLLKNYRYVTHDEWVKSNEGECRSLAQLGLQP